MFLAEQLSQHLIAVLESLGEPGLAAVRGLASLLLDRLLASADAGLPPDGHGAGDGAGAGLGLANG